MTGLSVAVVVPVLNEAESLLQHMGKFKSLHDECSLVFCDGGSEDETCALLQKHSLHYCHSLRGRALQMNTGASACESDILVFIHADTTLSSRDIELVKKTMQDSSVVGGRFDIRLSGKKNAFRVIELMINLRSRMTGISTGDQCQFVRREVFNAMGGFPEQALMEDVAFSKQLKQYGKIACLKNKLVTSSRRWEKHGVVKTIMLMWKLRFLYWLGTSPEKLAEIYRNVR
ncbi:MAG: TIGR04283 family arsenosugar biosynthesis glycosyltransferase [Mariprofundaceae bacterium]|nr:TIGR04283 family arsenosugar biosynthesis glycosyltransferase [Mariprofundaceae bacterium]